MTAEDVTVEFPFVELYIGKDDNNNLLRIRNYLLPLLMSGQATISD